MFRPRWLKRLPQTIGESIALWRAWNPVGECVVLKIIASGDPLLCGREIRGTIRSVASSHRGTLARAMIELHRPVHYAGHYVRRQISTVVTTPYREWHDLERLLVASANVRVLDAASFFDDPYDRIIARAAMRLDLRASAPVAPQWSETVADLIARIVTWSPISRRLSVTFDDSDDERLSSVTVTGVVRACNVRTDGTPTDMLIELDKPITHAGHTEVRWLVARPCLRWYRTNRLLLSWSAARLINASSFVDATFDRTVGIGRVHLLRR